MENNVNLLMANIFFYLCRFKNLSLWIFISLSLLDWHSEMTLYPIIVSPKYITK